MESIAAVKSCHKEAKRGDFVAKGVSVKKKRLDSIQEYQFGWEVEEYEWKSIISMHMNFKEPLTSQRVSAMK